MIDQFTLHSCVLVTPPDDIKNPAKWAVCVHHQSGGPFATTYTMGVGLREAKSKHWARDVRAALHKWGRRTLHDERVLKEGSRPSTPTLRDLLYSLASDAMLADEYTLDAFADEMCEGMRVSEVIASYAACQGTLAYFRKCGVDVYALYEASTDDAPCHSV